MDSFTATFRKCFDKTKDIDTSILNLLIGRSTSQKTNYNSLTLAIEDTMIGRKFVLFISNRFRKLYWVIFVVSTVTVALIVLFDNIYSSTRPDGFAWNSLIIWMLLSSMYFGAFCLSYQRKVSAYAICFIVIVLAGAFMYCQTSKIEYSLLGSSSLIFVCLFYMISFRTFMFLTLISIAGFVVCIIGNW